MKRFGHTARGLPAALLLLLLPAAGCWLGEPPPSVVLITLDTTRADRLGVYGYQRDGATTSPRLDALAAQGVVFERAIAQASNTPVSHASILTGLFPYNHGLRVLHGTRNNRLPDHIDTLAEILDFEGYSTGAFVSAFPVAEPFGFTQGFQTYDADFLTDDGVALVSDQGTVNTGMNQRRADATTDAALAWLQEQDNPFFLWVHYFDPHDVLVLPPTDFIDPHEVEGIQRDKLLALYDHEVRFMDRELGRLLEAVAAKVPREQRIVVVVADHGEGLGDHDWWSHGLLYQEQIRVPLVIQAPIARSGHRVDQTVRTVDIVPTVLDLVGIGQIVDRATFDGVSLVPLLAGARLPFAEASYSDSFSPTVYLTPTTDPLIVFEDDREDVYAAIIRDEYKYIHHLHHPEKSELYNLRQDPEEAVDLAQLRTDIVEEMRVDLATRGWRQGDDAQQTPFSPEELERLKSLGYLQNESEDGNGGSEAR